MTASPPIASASEARAQLIRQHLRAAGVTLVASLPDQWTGDLIRVIQADPEMVHVSVTREDDGVGLCAGAALGGLRAVLICQNAGLLLSGNALAGYAHSHQLPFVILCALRGQLDDAYFYQAYKGRVTVPVLEALQIPYHQIGSHTDLSRIDDAYRQAFIWRTPVVLLLNRQVLTGEDEDAAGS